ncbi:MAG: hypothetical protein PHH26_04315 [Candidatus Thermoplasmatota archaeon]|nr:hypothetical protein [Candidatus Thermoplasmatota archaeon]
MIDDARHAAVVQQAVRKEREFMDYARNVLQYAHRSPNRFAADIVPEHLRPLSATLSGNVFHALERAHLIEPIRLPQGQILRKKSDATTRKSAWVNCYKLVSIAAAERWLKEHGGYVPAQRELALW